MPSKKPIDYALAYKLRIERGLAKGLSRSQARGHPGIGQTLLSTRKTIPTFDAQLEAAVRQMRSGSSLTQAARSVGVSSERVRSYLTSQEIGQKIGRRWQVGADNRIREMLLFANGRAIKIRVRGFESASRIATYMSSVGWFLETNRINYLRPFRGESVKDVSGGTWTFETNANNVYSLSANPNADFAAIYRVQM